MPESGRIDRALGAAERGGEASDVRGERRIARAPLLIDGGGELPRQPERNEVHFPPPHDAR